ncbi:MAG: DUF721 domain-containing protein [Geminicoccaceae bacterium]
MAKAQDPRFGHGTRRGGPARRLNDDLSRLVAPSARKQGFGEARLLADWRSIVGEALASRCMPVRLSTQRGARTLHVQVEPGFALEVQHDAPRIMQRINGHFGCRMVSRLQLLQAPMPTAAGGGSTAAPAVPLSPADERGIAAEVAAIEDEGLRAALNRLGRALYGRRQR